MLDPNDHAPSRLLPFTRADIEQTIPQRFEAVVARYPDRLALSGHGERWTFGDLDRRVTQIAHAIRTRVSAGRGVVGYLAEQSPEMVILALAILKAGRTYLAIHPRLPLRAQADIVADIAPDLIVTTREFAARAGETAAGGRAVLVVEDIDPRAPQAMPKTSVLPQDAAAIYYTSGTTGRAKGVVRSHRKVLHRVWLSVGIEAVTPADRFSVLTHPGFASSEADIFAPLLQGASVHVFDPATEGFAAFRAWLHAEQVTVLHPPVRFFRRFLATLDDRDRFPSVRIVALAGEVVHPADIERWKRHFLPGSVVHHRFSTTETAIVAVARIDHDTDLGSGALDSGTAVPDMQLTLVDEAGAPVAAGEVGELVVTSAYLSDGYWRRPAETAATFTPVAESDGLRCYRTGDLGRWRDDGRFVFVGRRDHQVKVRGFRVDIRETESALLAFADVSEAAVIASREHEEIRLVAFVVQQAGRTWDPVSLRERLAGLLPDWKIPDRFEPRQALPMTLTGKVDRQRLLRDAESDGRSSVGAEMASDIDRPVDAVERMVADAYARLLHRRDVGRHDDFFQLGGDSVLFAELHLQLERETGEGISLDGMLQAPSVAGVAALVRRPAAASPNVAASLTRLVPLRTAGSRPPLFFVHGGRGRTIGSPRFLDAFGSDLPIYGFRLKGVGGTEVPFRRVEDMAADYIAMMRQVQPAGPYRIGGVCAGGLIALEMARQLCAAGEAVAPMLLIDPALPPRVRPFPRYLGMRLALSVATGLLHTAMTRRLLERAIPRKRFSVDGHLEAWVWFRLAAYRYRPLAYDGPVHIVGSRSRLGRAQRALWQRYLTGELRMSEVGGAHRDVFDTRNEAFPTHVRAYAAATEAWLRQRAAAARSGG